MLKKSFPVRAIGIYAPHTYRSYVQESIDVIREHYDVILLPYNVISPRN